MGARAEANEGLMTAAPAGVAPRGARAARIRSALGMRSLRARMLVAFVGLLAIATVGSVVLARQVLESRLADRRAAELQQEVNEFRKTSSVIDPATGKPFGSDVRRLFAVFFAANAWSQGEVALGFIGGKPFLRSPSYDPGYRLDRDSTLLATWGNVQVRQRGSADTPAGRVDYLAVPVRQGDKVVGAFVAAQFYAAERSAFTEAYLVTIAVAIVVLLVGSLLAWRMADRILRPVKAITATARGISESDLTRRIEVRGGDEIAALAKTFNGMLDRLEQAFGSQRRFLDDAGHELRTPITIVRGHLELLEDDPAEREETLTIVLDELDRMGRMVNELILLAKAERPDFLRREPVDVAALTEALVTKASALGAREWVLDDCGHGTILADHHRLTEAVMQLAENAEAHTEEGQQIGIGSALDTQSARFWVRDPGCGIPHDDQTVIFDRFERRGPRSGDRAHFGLGLAIVRAIAEAHGGTVVVESDPGRGATFTIDLSLAAAGRPGRSA
jgi:two-component system OmpR family sensor kinase